MKKFTSKTKKSKKKTQIKTLFKNDFMSIIKKDNWSFIKEPDNCVCIPILMETNEIILRLEDIPSYRYKDNRDYHLTCISGTIEEQEHPNETMVRELEEEAGIRLDPDYKIEMSESLFKNKSTSSVFNIYILPIYERDYTEVKAKGDGSECEENSKSVKVNIKNIDRLFPSDVITRLLLQKVKKFMNLV